MGARFGRKTIGQDADLSVVPLIDQLAHEIFAMQVIGWPRAISQFGVPYVAYRWGEKNDFSQHLNKEFTPPGREELIKRVRVLFETWRDAGNNIVVWRRQPEVDYDGALMFRCHAMSPLGLLGERPIYIPPAD